MPAAQRKTPERAQKPPAAPRPIPIAGPPSRELTGFQALLGELAADLIVRGGNQADVLAFLTALAGHNHRRDFGKPAGEDLQKYVDRWLDKLAASRCQREDPKHPHLQTLTDYIRADYRGSLEDHFEKFLNSATPESVMLMDQVFYAYDAITTGREFEIEKDTIQLAEAFAGVIGRWSGCYVRVPHQHLALVRQYIDLLSGKPRTAIQEVKNVRH